MRYRFLNFKLLLTTYTDSSNHSILKEGVNRGEEECAFNYPRLRFNLIYYRPRTLGDPCFSDFGGSVLGCLFFAKLCAAAIVQPAVRWVLSMPFFCCVPAPITARGMCETKRQAGIIQQRCPET